MGDDPILECSFLLPVRRDANLSDGALHEPELWAWLDRELLSRFNGRTVAPGHYAGFYRDPDTQERVDDLSYRYIVAIPESKLDELRSYLSTVCEFFAQKCIYLSIAGRVEFIEGAIDDS